MATFNFNKVNLAAAQIPSAITASQTSITVDASESALFPTVPFFATIMPAGGVPNTLNSEIVQVTAVNTSTGVLTITRAQRSTTAKAQDEGAVIMNGVYIEDLAQAQAVGLAFFSATNVSVSSSYSYWNIDNAMLPTAPTNGMSIRVVFGADTSGPAAQLRLNGGTYHNVYAGVGLTATASNVNTTTPFNPKSGIIYELVYYNNAWYAMNVPANNSITSDNVDWATLRSKELVLVDRWEITESQNVSEITLNVPSDIRETVEEVVFECSLANISSTSEYFRMFINYGESGNSYHNNFHDVIGSFSTNNSNLGAGSLPTTSDIISSGVFHIRNIKNTLQKIGDYTFAAYDWYRQGTFSCTTDSAGVSSVTAVINNGSGLTLRYGSWANLYVRTA